MSKNLVVHFNREEWEKNVELANKLDLPLAKLVVKLLREARTSMERVQNEQPV